MKNFLIITIDYETWQPSCLEEVETMKKLKLDINWERDLIEPTNTLLDIADRVGAKITFMAEMGEYFWLKDNEPNIAQKIASQLQNAVIRGHDVQLHLHPHWMPETGAQFNNGNWFWNIEYASAADYPYDLNELIRKCKNELEKIVSVVKPDYKVSCFRAGGYRVQPFEKIYNALIDNSIFCDSSVYANGISKSRGYDFSMCKDGIHPYYAKETNPASRGKDCGLVEIPIYSYNTGTRWMIDGLDSECFAYNYLNSSDDYLMSHNYYVMVGHTKENHNYEKLEQQLLILNDIRCNEWKTLGDVVNDGLVINELKKRDINIQQIIDDFEKKWIFANIFMVKSMRLEII